MFKFYKYICKSYKNYINICKKIIINYINIYVKIMLDYKFRKLNLNF